MMTRSAGLAAAALLWASPLMAVKDITGPLPDAAQSVSTTSAADDERVWELADRQFRASYYYSGYLLAGMQGRFVEATVMLQRAADSDPLDLSLKKELAEHYELMGQPESALKVLHQAVDLDPSDFGLRSKLAHLMVRLGELEDARAQYLEYLESNPGHRQSLHALASLEAAQGKVDEALDLLRKVLKAYPDSVSDMELYADLLARREGIDKDAARAEAEEAWKQLLLVKPKHTNGWYRLALLQEESGKIAEAETTLRKGLENIPDSFLLLDGLARYYYRNDRYEFAERAFNLSHLANPMDGETLLFLGMSRLQLKKYELAEKDFVKVAGILQEESASQLYGLGLSLSGQDKFDEAEDIFEKLVKKFPKAVLGYTQLALIYDDAGKDLKTLEILRQGLEANPKEAELYLMLAAAHMDREEYADAETALGKGLDRSDSKGPLRFQLAALYDKTDRFDKAERELKALIEDEPENAQALNYLGYSWAERGKNLKEAEKYILRALKVDPENFYYMDSLGWVLFKQGRFEEAFANLQKAAVGLEGRFNKEDAVILDHLGDALVELGRPKEAIKQYRAAVELRPHDADLRKKAGLPPVETSADAAGEKD